MANPSVSDVSICNNALLKIRANTITAIGQAGEEGGATLILYEQIRDDVLHAHPWNFAIEQATVALDGTSPLLEFDNKYTLPPDCLRVLTAWVDSDTRIKDFKVKGRSIHSDSSVGFIEYIKQVTDTSIFSPQFVDCFATRLAAELAYNLAGSGQRAEQLQKEYIKKLKEAKKRDGQEGIMTPLNISFLSDSRYTDWRF